VDWSITSAENSGNVYDSGTAVVIKDMFLFNNQNGYEVHSDEVAGLNVPLAPGTYWLNLSNATDNFGEPVYWDENSGPSKASDSAVGTIPSETFTIYGSSSTPTPEPGSIMLFGAGLLALAGVVRCKLKL